jgi:hypothetical protein
MGGEPALVVVVSPDAELRREIASRVLSDRAVVIAAPSLELAGPLLPTLRHQAPRAVPVRDLPAGLVVDDRQLQVSYAGVRCPLTPHEYDLLVLLLSDPDKVWKHQDLHLAVWHTEVVTNHGDLDATVKRLRRKLATSGIPLVIQAVRGFGYRVVVADDAS